MLQTVNGRIDELEAGRILVHEHVMVGFMEDGKMTPDDYNRDEVVEMILPQMMKLREAGCSTFGEFFLFLYLLKYFYKVL
ncbi:hypothetical protein [Paenibacillus sp. sgz500958]|uniref:hypothetical protein n=1 Tax=Paenibacillus sp. sgz500958 TaxID=3242475 RepID=UPI0036D24004